MTSTPPAPVLVIGGGPVGLAAALLLARHGVGSTVVEAQPRRVAVGSRSICVQRDVLDVLDRVGCAVPVLAEGVTWTVGRTYYRDVEVLTTTFPDTGRGAFPPFVNVPQTSVERYLDACAAAEPLVTVLRGARAVALAEDGDGVSVELADGRTLRAAWVVGADGPRSLVRTACGIGFPGHSFTDQFLICDVRTRLDFPAERRFYFDPPWNPGRQVLVHPQPDDVWRIDWQVPDTFDLDAERASGALEARVRRIVGERPYELVWVSRYRFHQRLAETYRRGRCLLAGDAAHLMAPFGARGLNSGLQDAENLAWKLAHVMRGLAPPSLLDSYHTERHAAGAENLRVTGATMRFLVPRTPEERAHRTAVLEASVTDAAARPRIDSGRLAEPFRYTDSPLTTPAAAEPAPGDLAPDGPCVVLGEPGVDRLRRCFGTRWTLLVADGDAVSTPDRPLGPGGPALVPRRLLAPGGEGARRGDVVDVEGVLRAAYRGAGAWLVRPDGHVAAVVLDPGDRDGLAAALHRGTGRPPGVTPPPGRPASR